jgi:hypothetical protein
MRNPELWELIATTNKLSTKLDASGLPAAKLKRGTVLELPSQSEVKTFLANKAASPAATAGRNLAEHTFGLAEIASNTAGAKAPRKINAAKDLAQRVTASQKNAALTRSSDVRVITQEDLSEGTNSLLLRLELKHKDTWFPVVEYSVNTQFSGLKLYDTNGEKKRVAIQLPTRAARELAENDIAANSQAYCEKFLSAAGLT